MFEIGDRVRHISKPYLVGTIVEFHSRYPGVLVDLSGDRGIDFRWFWIKSLEKIDV